MRILKSYFTAFTTLEMIVVIGLIVTLSTVLFNSVGNHLAKARDAKRKGDVKAIQVAIEEYEKDNNCYPAPSLVACAPLDTGLTPYLNKIPCDPKTGASYDYDNSGGTCPSWYRLFTNLENDKDLARASCAPNCGPGGVSDFYISSPNAPQALAVVLLPTPTPPVAPTPTPTATPAVVPLAYVGLVTGTRTSAGTSVVTSSAVVAEANNLYIAVVNTYGNVDVTGVTGLCPSWSPIAAKSTAAPNNLEAFYCLLSSPAPVSATVTANFAASATRAVMAVYRFRGANLASPIGNNATAGASSTGSGVSVGLTVSTANSYVLGAIGTGRRSISTAGSGYTVSLPNPNVRIDTGSNANSVGVTSEYKPIAATGSTPVSATLSSNAWWAIIAIEIKD